MLKFCWLHLLSPDNMDLTCSYYESIIVKVTTIVILKTHYLEHRRTQLGLIDLEVKALMDEVFDNNKQN